MLENFKKTWRTKADSFHWPENTKRSRLGMHETLEFLNVTTKDLPHVSYLCLWGVGKKQKAAMKEHMERRLTWIEEMFQQGLEIVVALGPRKSRKGLIEYLPIDVAPEPVKGQDSLFLNCIWVLPRFQKAGLGKRLMHHFLNRAKKVGGASVLAYEGDKWFGYFNYMPTTFFNRFGFKEVSRDETRVLLHLDLGAQRTPELLLPQSQRITKKARTAVDVFCNSQCPWSGWMADEVSRNAKSSSIMLRRICTDSRETIEEVGLARGISINGRPVIKRMAAWKEIKSALEKPTSKN